MWPLNIMDFCKLTWVRAIAMGENIAIFPSRHLQNQGFEAWLWVCCCLRSGLGFQCLFSFFFPFLSPRPELKAQPCLMIVSVEDGKEGYSSLCFVVLYHWLPFLNSQSLTWRLPPCTWRIESLRASGEVRSKYFGFSTHCIVELSQTKGSFNISLEKRGCKYCLPRKTGTGLCFSLT